MRCLQLRGLISVVSFVLGFSLSATGESAEGLRVATFRCDITPPLGQPMTACDALRTVEQPLLAKGIVLEDGAERYVLCALDWCELCNGAYDSVRAKLAEAAGVDPAHVAVQTVHQHTAPLVDTDAQRLLAEVVRAGNCSSIRTFSTRLGDVWPRRSDSRSTDLSRSIRSARGRPRWSVWRRAGGPSTRQGQSAPV